MQSNDCMNQDDNPYAASPSLTSQAGVAPNDTVAFGEFNPFRAIWIAPRKTIRRIVDADPSLHVVLLACLAGIGRALDRASMRNAGDKEPFVAIIASAFVFGPLGGLLSVWIGSHLIRWSGKWIGGTGSRPHIKAAIAWASVPAAFALPLWIPALAMFGPEMFTEEMPTLDDEPQMLIPFMAFAVAEVVLGVWALVLLCNTVTEVQGFKSAWAGLVNLVLAGAVILVPILVIGFGLVVASRA